ncbi:MAG TPA: class II fructose-bisphosphate aldolase, partial [Flavobacteriales bacterium]|nr:class II fructose-bisphosphate aldolase [Flavobacteriales bacterium]
MNIDTDTQWSFWDGVRAFELANRDYLQAQLGNPDGAEKPNKKYYDPRKWLREGEKATVNRLLEAFEDLNSLGAYDRM